MTAFHPFFRGFENTGLADHGGTWECAMTAFDGRGLVARAPMSHTMNILRLRIRPDAPINLHSPLTPTSPSVVTVRNSVTPQAPQNTGSQANDSLPRSQARGSVDGAAASAA